MFQPTGVMPHQFITHVARKAVHPRQFIDQLKSQILAKNGSVDIKNSDFVF
jgi:hypothetical protein